MSHVTTIDIEVRDLDALDEACRRVGLELVRDKKTYKWYGTSVGDTPLPQGFEVEDLGHCEHAIRVPGNPNAYEIGIATARNGRPGYQMLADLWNGGCGLISKAGPNCSRLKQAYATVMAKRQAHRQGFAVREEVLAGGHIRLHCTKY